MTKLERLLKRIHEINHWIKLGGPDDLEALFKDLGRWVYLLWIRGNLGHDAARANANMKLKNRQPTRREFEKARAAYDAERTKS